MMLYHSREGKIREISEMTKVLQSNVARNFELDLLNREKRERDKHCAYEALRV